MAKKEIIVCDNCGKEIKESTEIYNLVFKSIGQWHDVYDRDYNYIKLDFCRGCAQRAVKSLESIASHFNEAVKAKPQEE